MNNTIRVNAKKNNFHALKIRDMANYHTPETICSELSYRTKVIVVSCFVSEMITLSTMDERYALGLCNDGKLS